MIWNYKRCSKKDVFTKDVLQMMFYKRCSSDVLYIKHGFLSNSCGAKQNNEENDIWAKKIMPSWEDNC